MKRTKQRAKMVAILLLILTTVGLWIAVAVKFAPMVGSSTAPSEPEPDLSVCFGHQGVEFSKLDAYVCEVKLGDDPSGSLYFMTTLGNSTTGENVLWYKLHPAPGNFWVYETLTPKQSPSEPKNYGRVVQIDEGKLGQCIVVFTSWSGPAPTQCRLVKDGGAVIGGLRKFTAAEASSMAEFEKNMRGDNIPIEYR